MIYGGFENLVDIPEVVPLDFCKVKKSECHTEKHGLKKMMLAMYIAPISYRLQWCMGTAILHPLVD